MAAAKKAPSRVRRASSKKTKQATRRPAGSKRTTPKTKNKTAAQNKPKKKLQPAKKDTLKGGAVPRLPHSVSLSKLNPFRLPVSPDQLAIATARYAGAFFVVAGGIFAFYHLQFFNSSVALINGTAQTATICDAGYACDESTTTTMVDPTPDVSFEVHADEPLQGTVPVSALVPYAQEVELSVYSKDSADEFPLGFAERISDSEWKADWQTSNLQDGDYKLRAVIVNEYGTYDQYDATYYKVAHESESTTSTTSDSTTEISPESTTDTSTESSTEENTTAETEPVPLIDLLPGEPLSGDVAVEVTVSAAEEVRIELQHIDSGNVESLGRMEHVGDDTWKLSFDSAEFADGHYSVIAYIKNQYTRYSGNVQTEIQNGDTTTGTTNTTENQVEDTTSSSSTEEETVTVDGDADPESYETVLKPEAKIDVRESSPLSGAVDVRIDINKAEFVEVYATGRYSLIERFLGLAQRIDTDRWNFRWDTTNTPNGEHKIFARVKNQYGLYQSDTELVRVFNEVATNVDTDETETTSEESETESADTIQDSATGSNDTAESVIATPLLSPDSTTTTSGTSSDATDETNNELQTILDEFREEIDAELQRLATAIRSGDEDAVTRVRERLDELEERVIDSALSDNDAEVLTERLKERIRELFNRLETDTERTEAIVRERVGEEVTRDSDNDGITDYDERKIYQTDPETADSDGDGFVDGAEILNGYDPNDPKAEVLVSYESPKEVGVTRDDLLKVENVVTATKTEEDVDATGVEGGALISGKALPNSFVTIYIFSTPIVVTVRTDTDGNWKYRFDKQLEDGTHEVYVGVTDNAGKIIAKSQPFRFIKEAQAFTPVDAATAAPVAQAQDQGGFATQNIILIVLSLSVVGIGITLIMIGLHLSTRRRRDEVDERTAGAAEGV